MRLRPSHERPAGELRPVVGTHRGRIATKQRGLTQEPSHVLPTDTVVRRNVGALMTEVVGHCQAFDAPAAGQAVAHEVHAGTVRSSGAWPSYAYAPQAS